MWLLVVDECVFCGQRHTHGGGTGDEPSLFGTRAPHCQELVLKGPLPDYDVQPADDDIDWHREQQLATRMVGAVRAAQERAERSSRDAEVAHIRAINEEIGKLALPNRRKTRAQQNRESVAAYRAVLAQKNGAGK